MNESEKLEVLNETVSSNISTTYIFEDRFPSTASPSVVIIFGLITISVSVLGITAVNKEKLRLLSTYSLALVIAFTTRFIFFLATVCMHAYNIDYNPIRVTTLLSAGISTVEIILVMCVCHFTKIIKRGSFHNIERLERKKSSS
jgi:tellurite resistance protein TehA-like permease